MTPLVSICMPAYNSAAHIEKSIETIAAQRFNEYELIIVNDGSTDNTGALAKDFIKKYKLQGYVLDIDNSGPEAARDYGFAQAKGDIYATLDSDDLWERDYLYEMVEVLKSYPDIGVCFSDFTIVYQNSEQKVLKSETVDFLRLDQAIQRREDVFIFTPGTFFRFSIQGMLLFPSCTVVRKNIYKTSGGYTKNFDRQISCDWDYALRISREAPTAFLKKVLMTKIFYEKNVSIDGIKTALSDIVVLKNLLDAGSLSEQERRIAKRRLAGRMYNVGYGFLDTDNYIEARKWIRKSFYEKPMMNNFKYLILTSMHSRLFAYFRQLKRSMAL
jgi:glycosyltransferase involved in cell wall biosynthesis